MGYNNKDSDYVVEESGLAYDLRQIYARDIIGQTLVAIKLARISQNYPQWYRLLKRDLFTEIKQKLEKDEIEMIDEKITEVKQILSKYNLVFLGHSKDATGHDIVENALCDLESTMTTIMDKEHHMYGYKEDDDDGL